MNKEKFELEYSIGSYMCYFEAGRNVWRLRKLIHSLNIYECRYLYFVIESGRFLI